AGGARRARGGGGGAPAGADRRPRPLARAHPPREVAIARDRRRGRPRPLGAAARGSGPVSAGERRDCRLQPGGLGTEAVLAPLSALAHGPRAARTGVRVRPAAARAIETRHGRSAVTRPGAFATVRRLDHPRHASPILTLEYMP